MTRMHVADAVVRGEGTRWTVGTPSVSLSFEAQEGLRWQAITHACGTTRRYRPARCTEAPFRLDAAPPETWDFQGGQAEKMMDGGQPVARLTLHFTAPGLAIRYRVIAYPGTSVLRLWVELENTSATPVSAAAVPLVLPLRDDADALFTHYWMTGGNSRPDHGQLHAAPVVGDYRQHIEGQATCQFTPWLALHRDGADGLFLALEYLGNWRLSVVRGDGAVTVSAEVPDLAAVVIRPGETLTLPVLILGAFAGTLDDMGVAGYDWQYRYLWDYTNMDYYARPKWAVPWFFCAQNLQEQFAERLAKLDMESELMRSTGFEMLWDDAGWSVYGNLPQDSYHSVFTSGYEGPDFRQTQRYLEKMGMRWLAWFTQRPSPGVMAAKVGAWGDFEWRSDAVDFPDWTADRDWRTRILRFLEAFPHSSFHTCSGGSTYAHTFDIQRYANTNYFADGGRGPLTNYYFSYVEPPDKWIDIIEAFYSKFAYRPATARQNLTMVPFWGFQAGPEDLDALRRDLDTYRHLRREGVAGRWSYLFHPAVEGDDPTWYAQRTSHDRAKACLIFKHQPEGPVTVYPRGLRPELDYLVEFDIDRSSNTRTGADLMTRGITVAAAQPGEMIYLNLPHRPRSGRDHTPPTAPGRVLARRETNLGHAGVALYWSPGTDDRWVSGYQVRRGDDILGQVCTGLMYFDHAEGWDPAARYAVRTVDGDGNVSAWAEAERLADESLTASALGGLFSEPGRCGWSAETTADGQTFTPMRWVAPPYTASADQGGTPNQPGGVEGWWEGASGARLGRAWMQSSREAGAVRTWTASIAGRVRVTSRVMKEWYRQAVGRPLRARVLHNGAQVWPARGWADVPLGDLTGAMHDLTLDVAAGDTVRFVLDRMDPRPAPNIALAETWTVFGPCHPDAPQITPDVMQAIPKALTVGEAQLAAQSVTPVDGRLDLSPLLGTAAEKRSAYLYLPLTAPEAGMYRIGLGVRGWLAAWLDGVPVISTMIGSGDADAAAGRAKHQVNMMMSAGLHLLVVRYVSDTAGAAVDIGVAEPDTDIAAWMPLITYLEDAGAAPEGSVVRINCGAARPYTDRLGHAWAADSHVTDGRPVRYAVTARGADDPALYRCARQGTDFTYRVPVSPSLYAVRLRFTEPTYRQICARPCHITLNGREELRNFDIAQDARGAGIAHDRVFRYVVPDADGCITLRLTGGDEPGQATDEALIQAIEILPERRPDVRINCGAADEFIDWNSQVWAADPTAGETLHATRPVSQASPTLYDQALYQTARAGREIAYSLALSPGLYTVHLKFAELWLDAPGQRLMDIRVNGRLVRSAWDPCTAAGEPAMAQDLRFANITPDRDGHLTITVTAVGEQAAILQGIEIE